jgi:F-type H+-transporting ATPase subunit b
MVKIDWTVLVQIANFVILVFILNLVLYKPIRNILRQRKDKLQDLTESITTGSKQAEARNQAFADGIKEARTKGQKEKEAVLQDAAEEERRMIADINATAKADLDTVKAQIAREAGTVKEELEKEVDTFADTITQKILGRAA